MWNWIVSFDKRFKKYALYRFFTLIPRLSYRLLIWIQKKIKKLKNTLSKWVSEKKEDIQQKWILFVQQIQEEIERKKDKELQARLYLENKQKKPVVSIVMPVYNAENYLRQTMDSILNQTLPFFELIAVDDGSKDNSLAILQEYAQKDARIRIFKQKNKYAGVARNNGMRHAKGKYVLFLDSDDFFEPNLLYETCYAALVNDAQIVLFSADYYNDMTKKFSSGRFLISSLVPEIQPFCAKDCPETIFQITTAVPWTKLFQRSFIRKNSLKFQSLHNANDVYFSYSALASAERIVAVDQVFVHYRMGMTTNLQSSSKRYFYEAYLEVRKKLQKMGVYEKLKRSFVNRTLASVLYNFHVTKDLNAKRSLFNRIQNEMLKQLNLSGHPVDFYYDPKNVEEMTCIQNSSFEEYMKKYGD